MPPIITVENLSKKYKISHLANRARYKSLRDILAEGAASLFQFRKRRMQRSSQPRTEDFWALKGVNFEINQGEVVGIIGRNGAGKSTLLKVLSRITKPTQGRIHLRGRVASLLEVGTGFHPELTGRENIYLNGAILGMWRNEIKSKFDEIVAFAGVEKFLDTPVKHYSSGMYVRLAFAVAAHLEPEILVIDEVLAVGDAEFQKKCLGKMEEIAKGEGRTILFVSHNMAAVQSLCTRAIVLRDGRVLSDCADPSDAIDAYSNSSNAPGQVWQRPAEPPREAQLVFRSMSASLLGDQPYHRLRIVAELESRRFHAPALVAFDILDAASVPIMQALPSLQPVLSHGEGSRNIEVNIDLPPLIPGNYQVTAWAGPHNSSTYDLIQCALSFAIVTSPTEGRSYPHSRDHGNIVPLSTLSSTTERTMFALCSK
jgi:lipopolysaccharide transport system ATP-binding protein